MMTYEQACQLYTARFSHTKMEKQPDGTTKLVFYRPETVCNRKEFDLILPHVTLSGMLLQAMRDMVGSSSPRKGRGDREQLREVEPFVPLDPCVYNPARGFEAVLMDKTIRFAAL